jgi:uncharacterized integral membrane protein
MNRWVVRIAGLLMLLLFLLLFMNLQQKLEQLRQQQGTTATR